MHYLKSKFCNEEFCNKYFQYQIFDFDEEGADQSDFNIYRDMNNVITALYNIDKKKENFIYKVATNLELTFIKKLF